MSDFTFRVRIDWNRDGDFSDAGEDVTTRILGSRVQIGTQRGRQSPRQIEAAPPAVAALSLNNTSRDYSPDYGPSPLHGHLGPGREVWIEVGYLGTWHTLFRGFLAEYKVSPGLADRSVSLTAQDVLGKIAGVRRKISTVLHEAIPTGEAIGIILDEIGWPSGRRDLDHGQTTLPFWWMDDGLAVDELTALMRAEGPPALCTVNADGDFIFRDRAHRAVDTVSAVSQATFSSAAEPDSLAEGWLYDAGWEGVINQVDFTIEERQATGRIETIWSSNDTITLRSGETRSLIVRPSDPFLDVQTPTIGFTGLSAADICHHSGDTGVVSASLSRSSGGSTTLHLTSTGGTAVITHASLRAQRVPVARTIRVSESDSSSINEFGARSYAYDAGRAAEPDATAIAKAIVARYKARVPTISFSVSGCDARKAQQIARDLSHRITVTETETGLDDDFFIERIEATAGSGGQLITQFQSERLPAAGTDSRDTVFRFDIEGQGFDDGLLAY